MDMFDERGTARERRVTRVQAGLLMLVLAMAVAAAVMMLGARSARAQGPGTGAPVPPPPQGGGFGRGGPMSEERKIVAQFDRDANERLDAAERKAAREWLATSGNGPRRFGGRGGRGLEAPAPGKRLAPADVRTYRDEPLYDLKTLRTVFLEFENPEWEQELADFHNTDVEVPATAIVDGKTYKDVGVHFRGASSFMMVPAGLKRSLNLSFDFVHGKQALHGYRTLNLLNANSDPTFVRPVLYAQIARAYIPAPKTNYMRVVINGESWGVYVNAQQYNRDFLRDHFGTERGARLKVPGSPGGRGGMEYLGDDPALYKRTYEIRTKDDPKVWADLIRTFRVLNETPLDKLEAALSPLLNIDGVLKFLAIEMALVNTDGYWTRASDYSIYQDEAGRFHVIPHDMNEAMLTEGGRGRGGRGPMMMPFPPPGGAPPPAGGPRDVFAVPGQDGPPPAARGGGRGPGRGFGPSGGGPELDPLVGLDDPTKPLRSRLLAVPALRARYLSYVRDIAERWLDWKTLEPLVKEYQALIAEDVRADTKKLYSVEAFQSGVSGSESSLQAFVTKRREFLLKATEPGGGGTK
jgi:spore coat protein CotH